MLLALMHSKKSNKLKPNKKESSDTTEDGNLTDPSRTAVVWLTKRIYVFIF